MIDEKLMISPSMPVRDAIDRLVSGGKKVVFIVQEWKLLGLFTNGDMRETLLTNTDFSRPIEQFMNRSPVVFSDRAEAIRCAGERTLIVYPIVDRGRLVDALFEDDPCFARTSCQDLCDVPLVIMAGGKGTRLYPLTQILPKALTPIGEMTVTERIIRSFQQFGCRQVYMILNHRANMIKTYFADLPRDYELEFETESRFLGTGGGLYLLKDKLKSTFMVSNCDILIDDDLACVYRTHRMRGNAITMVCSSKKFPIPYSMVTSNEAGEIVDMVEKPQLQYLVNTGVYVLEPEVLEHLEDNECIGLPDFIRRCARRGMKVGIFPVSDGAWLDMGQFDTLNQMLDHFGLSMGGGR